MEPVLDRAAVAALVDAAGRALTGEWLLVGGAAAAVWFDASRRTEDVDLIGLAGTAEERIALMDFAVAAGLSPEVVNSAADYFVRRIPGWREAIEVLHRGPNATIYRPSPTLFLLLKIGRLSEKDLADCVELIAFARETGARIDLARVVTALAALPATTDTALSNRRLHLADNLRAAR